MNAFFAQLLVLIRHRPYITGSVVLTLLLGGVNFFLWQGRRAAAGQHDEIRRQGETLIVNLGNRPHIDADLAAVRTALDEINRNLLDEQSMEVNLGYFYRLEKNTQVQLVRLNQLATLPATAGNEFKVLPFSLQVTGSYRNNLAFLRALETGPHVLRIRSCSVERQTLDKTDVTMDLDVEILSKA